MCKKLLIVGVIAAVGASVFGGTKVVRYIKSEIAEAREWAEAQVPVEEQIRQLKKDVKSLDRDIDGVKDELAREIVECRELAKQSADLRTSLEAEEQVLVQRGEMIKDGTERVKYGSYTIPAAEAKSRLNRDVALHMRKKQTLDSMEKALVSHERIKDSLEKKLDSMVKQKQELMIEIEAVEADIKELELQQVESKYQTDNSRLAKIKDGIRKLRKNAEIEREKLNLTQTTSSNDESIHVDSNKSVDEILAPLSRK